MDQYDIEKNLNLLFENGKLPTTVYMFKQIYNNKKIPRPLHSHNSICELVIVYEGIGTYRVDNRTYYLEKGDIAFCNQDDLHEISSNLEGEIGTYCLGITNLCLKGMKRNHFVKHDMDYVRKSGTLFSFIQDICEQIYSLDSIKLKDNLVMQLLCATIISLAVNLENFKYANFFQYEENQFILSILNYLNNNYTDSLTLGIISKNFNCSVSYISHALKRAIGKSPIQYLIQRRIGLAQNLLISSEMTVAEISIIVGYENTNYFTTLFTKFVGMAPIEYRKYYLNELCGDRQQL